MSIKLMYITNDQQIAKIAEDAGVDWIFLDLEIIGKAERQGHLDTVMSRHSIADVKKIKNIISSASLLVRINPMHPGSINEIDQVIEGGADIIMLPFFKTANEVKEFILHVNGRVKTCLLCETPQAVENIDEIINLSGIDYIHIGLNDLHLGYGMKFMFEPLANGIVEMLAGKFKSKGIPFGFGGIARIGQGALSADMIITEHCRLGSEMVILSRTFCNVEKTEDLEEISGIFTTGINEIRSFELSLKNKPEELLIANKLAVAEKVQQIVNRLQQKSI